MSVVFDASSAILGALADVPEAEAIRSARPHLHEHYGLRAPWLLAWEVGHVVHRKFPARFAKTHERRVAVVDTLLRDLDMMQPTAAGLRRTAKVAEARGLSFYDAAYLELASQDDVSVLVTEDQHLLRAASAELRNGRAYDARGVWKAITDGEM